MQTIEAQIKGTDPTDTMPRQVAVFKRLQNDISETKYARNIKGPFIPGEQKTMQAYSTAGAELISRMAKFHTTDEVTAFNKLSLRYVFNQDL